MMTQRTATMLVILATLSWGFMGMVCRKLATYGMTSMEISFLRLFFTTVIVLFVILLFKRSSFRIRKRDIGLLALMGITRCVTDILIYQSQLMIPIGITTVLQNTAPYYIMMFSVFLFKEKIGFTKLMALVIGFSGCIFATGALDGEKHLEILGIVCALGGGFFVSIYDVMSKYIPQKGYDNSTVLFWSFLCGTIFLTPAVNIPHLVGVMSINLEVVMYALVLVVVMSAVPCYMLILAMNVLEAGKTSILLLMEIVFSVCVGAIFYNELLNYVDLLGIALIMFSAILISCNVDLKKLIWK